MGRRVVVDGAALLVLAVPDPAITSTAAELVSALPSQGVSVIHLSGLLGVAALAPLADVGIDVGAFHPFQSFPRPRPPAAFAGSTLRIEASSGLHASADNTR